MRRHGQAALPLVGSIHETLAENRPLHPFATWMPAAPLPRQKVSRRTHSPPPAATKGGIVKMHVGHMEGNYTAPPDVLDALEGEGRVVFRYCDASGEFTEESNLNGSRDHIAGICSRGRNVLGLMPHPERACEDLLGSSDGSRLFRSLAATLAAAAH